ncbi:MAG: transcription factor S [Candidatus Aenigmarchaeota archaeon]|nr:transcription factor S [Candidatus Aenigmarchaeota archaeon]
MDVQFCECGGIFEPIGKGRVRCRSCGKEMIMHMGEKITTQAKKEEVIVIEDTKPDRLPTTMKVCPKCGHKVAYWWLIQTRSSDEPPTQFFRCENEKCKHTWREYK